MTACYQQIKPEGLGVEFRVLHSAPPSHPLAICPTSPSIIHTFSSHFLVILPGTHPVHLYLDFFLGSYYYLLKSFLFLSPLAYYSRLTYLLPFFRKCFLSTDALQ